MSQSVSVGYSTLKSVLLIYSKMSDGVFDSKYCMQELASAVNAGVALILIALELMRATVTPIRDSAFLPQMAIFLERDFITAFLVGAVLTFIMHSSVAAVLGATAAPKSQKPSAEAEGWAAASASLSPRSHDGGRLALGATDSSARASSLPTSSPLHEA